MGEYVCANVCVCVGKTKGEKQKKMNVLCENVFEDSTLQSSNIDSPRKIIHLVIENSFEDERERCINRRCDPSILKRQAEGHGKRTHDMCSH